MKIFVAIVSIAIVATSSIVALLTYHSTKDNLSLRTKQVEQMIARHLQVVSRDHKHMIETEHEIVQVLKNQGALLNRMAIGEERLQDMAATNQKILRTLEATAVSKTRPSLGP